jgi:hypothetical protein
VNFVRDMQVIGTMYSVSAPADWPGKCLLWYAALTPFLWATGLLDPLGSVGIIALYLMRPKGDGHHILPWLWFAVAVAQGFSTVIYWDATDQTYGDLAHMLLSEACSGWVLIGMCIGIGASYKIAEPTLVRAICIKAGWVLVFSAISYVMFAVLGLRTVVLPSLLQLLHPSDAPYARFHFFMRFYGEEDFLGSNDFRLQLFYPWSTALGIAGVLPVLLAWRERSPAWRIVGLLGGIAAVVLSYSRSVFLGVAVVFAVFCFFRMTLRTQIATILAAIIALNAVVLLGVFDPTTFLSDFHNDIDQARAGSSQARNFLYAAEWQGFLRQPWLGQGWFGQNYARWLPAPIGSHSSFYGVLYRGGILTFGAACLAYLATFWSCLTRWAAGSRTAATALAQMFLFGLSAYGENMETLAVPLLFAFIWIGSELSDQVPRHLLSAESTDAGMAGKRRIA